MTFIATNTEEQLTGQSWPVEPYGLDELLYPDSLSWHSQDFISPMDEMSIDNASLRNFSPVGQAKPSDSLDSGKDYCCVCTHYPVHALIKLMALLRILVILGPRTLIHTNHVRQTFPGSKTSMTVNTMHMGIIRRRKYPESHIVGYSKYTQNVSLIPLAAMKGQLRSRDVLRIPHLSRRTNLLVRQHAEK